MRSASRFRDHCRSVKRLRRLLGEPDGPPLLPPIALTDEVTALVGAFATLAALRHAEKTGEGQYAERGTAAITAEKRPAEALQIQPPREPARSRGSSPRAPS